MTPEGETLFNLFKQMTEEQLKLLAQTLTQLKLLLMAKSISSWDLTL